jgi:hypothetical protein
MAKHYMLGKRIELISTTDPITKLEPGDKGTVVYVGSNGVYHTNWDNGINLGLLPGVDRYKIIEED